MIELLIFGLILFIIGVGATIIYDKYKDKIQDLSKIKESFGKPDMFFRSKHEQEAFKKALNPAPKKQTSKSLNDMNEEFLERFSAHMKQNKKAPTKKLSQKKTLTSKDLSINSTLTVQELMDKIQEMKKKQ